MLAKVLCANRNLFHGCVKLLFQPAEEKYGGALPMIKEGVLDGSNHERLGPAVHHMYGLHLKANVPTGCVDVRAGPILAAIDEVEITVIGKGGHGAYAETANDSIIAACSLVNSLTTIIPRNVSGLDTAVFTLGTFHAGYASNVIADRSTLTGTVRTFNEATRQLIQRRVEEICHGVEVTFNVTVQLGYNRDYNVTINRSLDAVNKVREAAGKVVNLRNVRETQQWMGSEDMSFLLDAQPNGAFFFVGAHPTNATGQLYMYPHHKSTFDIDESSLLVGTSIWLYLVESILG